MSTQVGVEIITNPQLSDFVFDWIRLGSRACMLKLKVKDRSLCLLQVYAPNTVSEYLAFVDDVNDVLQRVGLSESTILSGDFNADIGTDSETWKDVIGRQEGSVFHEKARKLLKLCVAKGSAL